MKILTGIDVPFQPFGGSLIVCNDWYSNLPNDIEVRFLTLPSPAGVKKWWTIRDVVFLDVEKKRGVEEFPAYVKKLSLAVQQQIADFKPDIIHCQHLNFGLSRVFADLKTDTPRIGICHGTDVQSAAGHPFFKENMRIICDAMDELVFPNQNMANDFFALYGKTRSYVINPLGIPDKYYRHTPRPVSFNGSRPLEVVYIGRLLHWKGADIAVKAMAQVRHDMRLTVIGNEDQAGYKAEMQQFIAEHGLGDRVTFQDQLPRDVLMEALDRFDVAVFPSTGLEAFSLTVVEAQAHGLPVVAAPGGGIINTVGKGGLILRGYTPELFAKALDALYEQPERLTELQQKGYQNAENYRLSRSQHNLWNLSHKLLV